MEKVKKAFGAAVSWFGVFWFVIFTIVSFPSFGTVIFLIGLTICLPIPVTRNFWNEKGLHGASKIALIAALIVAGAVMSPHEATETPSDAAEIVEVQEKTAPEENGTQTQAETETEVIPDNAIVLVAGEKGKYGRWRTMNGESFYAQYVPGGLYSVTNAGESPTQVSVYQRTHRNFKTGLDEYTATGDILQLDVGESGEITVPNGWFIEIHKPTKVWLIRVDNEPKPESIPESESEPDLQPIEETPEPVIEPVEEPAESKIDPTTMRGHGWSDQGREEPQYEGVEGFAVISSEYSSHLRWDDNFVNTPWPVDIYEKSGTRYENAGTINHKTPIMVLAQDLKHERYGRYSGYLRVQRLDDGSQFYIDVNCFVTKAYWNGSVYDAAFGGACIAEYHQKSEYPPTSNGRTDGERVEIADGKKVLITGTTGTSGKGPDRYTYPIEAVVFQNWTYGYGGVTIHFNSEDLTVVY